MACDMFSLAKANELLRGKTINFFGDSNTRALYKDLLWLLEDGRLIPEAILRCKNEESCANDIRLSSGKLHSGRNYEEIRLYSEDPYIEFHFITRLYLPTFIDAIKNMRCEPSVLVINSCVWDLTRWGSNGVDQFKTNVKATFSFLKSHLPSTRIIWLTTLPPSFKSQGGFLTKEIEFLRNTLPWHIVFANKYSSDLARSYNIDVLDLHYNFRFLLNYHSKDGIHWTSKAVRHATNMLLTHIALTLDYKLPGEFKLDQTFLQRSQVSCDSNEAKFERSNAITELKPKSIICHNTALNKRKNSKNRNTKTKSQFHSVSQNPHIFSNYRRVCTNTENRGKPRFQFDVWKNSHAFNDVQESFNSAARVNGMNAFNPITSLFSDKPNQPATNIWYNDCDINNFESTCFTTENIEQRFRASPSVWQNPYLVNDLKSTLTNAQNPLHVASKFNSRECTIRGSFSNKKNMQKHGRIIKRKESREISVAKKNMLKYVGKNL